MRYRLMVEDMEPDLWIAWVADLPGCYSSAKTSSEAVAQAPASIARHYSWLSDHDPSLVTPPGPVEVEVTETFHSFPSKRDPAYIVNAFFEDDKRPLGYWEVATGQRLLDWTHRALLGVVQSLDERRLNQPIPREVRGSIAGILGHVAGAENWYLATLGLSLDKGRLLGSPLEKSDQVRRHMQEQLWKLIGETRITENYDELWSARKVLRRALWHEQDHTQQIRRLATEL